MRRGKNKFNALFKERTLYDYFSKTDFPKKGDKDAHRSGR